MCKHYLDDVVGLMYFLAGFEEFVYDNFFRSALFFPYLLILTGWIPLVTLVTTFCVTLVTSISYVKIF